MRNLYSIAFLSLLLPVTCSAQAVPKEWTARQASYEKAIRDMNFKLFESHFSPDYFRERSRGRKTTRKDYLARLAPIFSSYKVVSFSKKEGKAVRSGDTIVFERSFELKMISKTGINSIWKAKDKDTWKLIKGKWWLVKTDEVLLSMMDVASSGKAGGR